MPFFSKRIENRQLLIQVLIGPPTDGTKPRTQFGRPYIALVDTGATSTCISPKIVKDSHLMPEGKKQVHTPTEKTSMNVYHVGFHIPIVTRQDGQSLKTDIHSNPNLEVTELMQPSNYDVLLGMDVLATCSLFIAGDTFTLGY